MRILSYFALVVLSLIGFTSTGSTVNLETILNSVEQHYPEVLAAGARVRAQEALVLRAQGGFDPVLSASLDRVAQGTYQNDEWKVSLREQIPGTGLKVGAEWSELNGKIPIYDGDRNTGSGGKVKGFIEAPLLKDLFIDRVRAGLRSSVISSAQSVEQSRWVLMDTYRLAALSYWSWLASAEKGRVYQNLLRIAEERDKAISSRVLRGEAPKIEGVDNQRMIRQRMAQLTKATIEAQKAALVLSLFYRDAKGQPQRLEADHAPAWLHEAPKPPAFTKLREALETHPKIQVAKKEVEQKELAKKLAKYNLLPSLDLRAGYTEYLGALPATRDQSQEAFVGFKFSMPIFLMEARGANAAADFELESARQKAQLIRQELEVDLEAALIEAKGAATISKLQLEESQFAKQVEAAERKRFAHGDSSLLNVNLREQDSGLAQIRAIDSLFDYQSKELELLLLTNSWERKY